MSRYNYTDPLMLLRHIANKYEGPFIAGDDMRRAAREFFASIEPGVCSCGEDEGSWHKMGCAIQASCEHNRQPTVDSKYWFCSKCGYESASE